MFYVETKAFGRLPFRTMEEARKYAAKLVRTYRGEIRILDFLGNHTGYGYREVR